MCVVIKYTALKRVHEVYNITHLKKNRLILDFLNQAYTKTFEGINLILKD